MLVIVLCLIAQSCLTLFDPMDCRPPGSSVHGILGARMLEWVAIPSSRGSSQPRDQTQVSHTAGRFFYQLSTGSPRLLEWVAFPTLGELPDLEIEPWSPALQADSLPAELPFLSTWASIRQEKKELNMLMLPPLLGDI